MSKKMRSSKQDDEWGPWEQPGPFGRDSTNNYTYEVRFHKRWIAVQRRCRHCKKQLPNFPPEPCDNLECQALNIMGKFQHPTIRLLNEYMRES